MMRLVGTGCPPYDGTMLLVGTGAATMSGP
jgi:hypothetical protein